VLAFSAVDFATVEVGKGVVRVTAYGQVQFFERAVEIAGADERAAQIAVSARVVRLFPRGVLPDGNLRLVVQVAQQREITQPRNRSAHGEQPETKAQDAGRARVARSGIQQPPPDRVTAQHDQQDDRGQRQVHAVLEGQVPERGNAGGRR
jgi:hypothetical protein